MIMTKTWFITGASSGLGRLMTERLLARGDRVVATVRHEDSLTDLQKKHGDRLVVPVLDLTDTACIRAVLASAFRQLGRIDVLVSNAGYGLFGAAEEFTDAQIGHQIAANLIGSIQFIRAAMPHLRQQGGGRIVQVSSEGGQIAYPAFSLYHATKWGIEGFIESAAQEVAPFGIDSLSSNPVRPLQISAPAWCAPRRWTSIRTRPRVRYAGLLPKEALSSRATLGAQSMP
jgi:NAD(P)-dependent dehydrogenase (short-subunit alcohol dehydrogenase family)